jgi:Uma2 family endonuclease
MVTLQLRQLHIPPGQRVLVEDVSWLEFAAIIEELGDHRGTRVAYSQGTLEIMSPSPEHEKAKVVISDLVKVLLDELEMPWESLGSTTFRREDMAAGIEPDDCFYIQHQAMMVGKDRIDLTVDPPPDLVIEVDVTSPTALRAYEALQVLEIWRYHHRTLQIYVWRDNSYTESSSSPTFPQLPVIEGIVQFVEMSRIRGTAPALRAFRHWIREHLQHTQPL